MGAMKYTCRSVIRNDNSMSLPCKYGRRKVTSQPCIKCLIGFDKPSQWKRHFKKNITKSKKQVGVKHE
jgi:hypothetical protein